MQTQKQRQSGLVTEPTETTDMEVASRGAAYPTIPNSGPMSKFVGPFDVMSPLTGQTYHVRFSHAWNAIATRHSDSVDTKFLIDGRAAIVGLAHTGFVKFRERSRRDLTDREASFVAAEYLKERLEEEDERPLYDVGGDELLRLVDKVAIR
jgi:hypothetical protein